MMKTTRTPRTPVIGEIYLMNFGGGENVQNGVRPGLVFQNNVGNTYSPNIIALPLTSSIKKSALPTHVFLRAELTGLNKDSMVLCENPECISKKRIGRYITTLSHEDMQRVTAASLIATSAISFLEEDALIDIWKHASELNRSAV